MARWHTCNVLQVDAESRRVWHFDARGSGFSLNREHTSQNGDPLPEGMVRKDWRTLWQRKLNVAWIAPQHVFLCVAQLPKSSFEETRSMVEFQLEKLSPIPVTQAVWTFHVLAQGAGPEQTVIVTIVARSVIEEFLTQLEGQKYLADRLEPPMLDQLQAMAGQGDGAWIFPDAAGNRNSALVAWWSGGVLRSVDLLTLSGEGDRAAGLRDQLTQMAWAGEMGGWLDTTPDWHLVAEGDVAAQWEPLLREATDLPVRVTAPLPSAELAALTARRAAQTDPAVGLLPPEFSTRYQQQFVDRLWMRGLFAAVGLYLVFLACYWAAVEARSYKTTKAEDAVKGQAVVYTNALQSVAKYNLLKRRHDLGSAALDCWLLAAANLPEDLTLESMNFSDGQKVNFTGVAPLNEATNALKFCQDMRKARIGGEPFFDTSVEDNYTANSYGGALKWTFGLTLKQAEGSK